MRIYLVKQTYPHTFGAQYLADEILGIYSTSELALASVDKPKGIIITSYEVDGGPDSERLEYQGRN